MPPLVFALRTSNTTIAKYGTVACIALLSGCAQLPATSDTAHGHPPTHHLALAALTDWHFAARFAVRYEEQGFSARMRWSQIAGAYTLQFDAPLGQGVAELSGDDTQAILRLPDRTLTASRPEELMERALGWTMPLAPLRYWVRGIASPDSAATYRVDESGRARTIDQAGWQVEFQHYRDVGDYLLPDRLILRHPASETTVRLVIDEWVLAPALPTPATPPRADG